LFSLVLTRLVNSQEKYTESPENHKSLSIMECISADGREPSPPAIIAPALWIAGSMII
jgi:hypothetical protein